MKILLISPTIDAEKRTNKALMIPQLALYILKGLTPSEHKVRILEEETEDIDFDANYDLIGISCMTANAPRAYDIAQEFEKKGKTVVLGGVHPTILPEEALLHSHCVVVGESEGVWEQLLADFKSGTLKRIYHNPLPNLDRYVPKDFSRIIKKRLFNLLPVMTTRGCPYNCDFCCVSNLYGKKIRHIPIENVIRDIRESNSKNYIFLDDNIIGDSDYAKDLFRALIPLQINWVGQASISLLIADNDLMQLARKSGCKSLFLGLESVSEEQLKSMPKAIDNVNEMKKALRKINQLGILIHASIVFGFDKDTPEIFKKTVKFLKHSKVSTASFNVLTPYPATKVYEKLKEENRLLTTDWRYYDHNTVVFEPKNMTAYELQMGKLNARKKFYQSTSILKRFLTNAHTPLIYLATNFGHMKQARLEAKRIESLKNVLFH